MYEGENTRRRDAGTTFELVLLCTPALNAEPGSARKSPDSRLAWRILDWSLFTRTILLKAHLSAVAQESA